jgi:phospholipase C
MSSKLEIDRRAALQLGAGLVAVVSGCGSSDEGAPRTGMPAADSGNDARPAEDGREGDAMATPEGASAGDAAEASDPFDAGAEPATEASSTADASSNGDAPATMDARDASSADQSTADATEASRDASRQPDAPLGPAELLSKIDTIVVLMMENRSFDHYLGQLKQDPMYASASRVDGLVGNESNPDSNGDPVNVFKLTTFTPADPPHDWDPCHAQWNMGKNDGFVKAHAGASERDVMGYYDRSQIAFTYWLADNFTVCDRWFASVMGPTWPNRFFLHATTSGGIKANSPWVVGGPRTIWEELAAKGKTGKNYTAGAVAWFTGGFIGKVLSGVNPVATLDAFFDDAKNGTLPNFAVVDPDFNANDDHPSHDVQLGQAFVASVYKALAASPQWSRMLFVVTYDEHGGFFDHVPPPTCDDERDEFRQLGFRVPSIVIGPMVRKGYVHSERLDHASVAATLATRFGISMLTDRMRGTRDLSGAIDPRLLDDPRPPPPPPPVAVPLDASTWLDDAAPSSQPELDAMIARGTIPSRFVDPRTRTERLRSWLQHAERLGIVRRSRR